MKKLVGALAVIGLTVALTKVARAEFAFINMSKKPVVVDAGCNDVPYARQTAPAGGRLVFHCLKPTGASAFHYIEIQGGRIPEIFERTYIFDGVQITTAAFDRNAIASHGGASHIAQPAPIPDVRAPVTVQVWQVDADNWSKAAAAKHLSLDEIVALAMKAYLGHGATAHAPNVTRAPAPQPPAPPPARPKN